MEHKEVSLDTFKLDGIDRAVSFKERNDIIDGVVCDVYSFVGDDRKDLGIINIKAGKKTPLQKVLSGDRTIEGYLSGKGKLTIVKKNGGAIVYEFDGKTELTKIIPVSVGEIMQWEADENSELIVSEIRYPPYEDGRFENIKSL